MPELTKPRPKFLALHEIRLPLPGFVSILHRVSGAGLFLMIPLLIWVLELSLGTDPGSTANFKALTGNPLVKLILFGLCWAYLHHFCAGVRFLLLDLHIGIDKQPSRTSATAVLVVSLGLTGLTALKFMGVF
jgi:succinate dehydrogenase / fumarate reductase cytochrome b subunit